MVVGDLWEGGKETDPDTDNQKFWIKFLWQPH